MKRCSTCREVQPRENFAKGTKFPDGLQYSCRSCTSEKNRAWYAANKARRAASQAAWYAANAERHCANTAANRRANMEHYRALNTDWTRLKRYGLTKERFVEMLAHQEGMCAICCIPFGSEPHVDHCHTTKVVRGLLCGQCNRALGLLKDDTARIRRAADYLERSRA